MHEQNVTNREYPCGEIKQEKGIQRLEAMLYALDEINASPHLLPNIRLGALILDTCSNPSYALEQAMEFVKAHMSSGNETNSSSKCPEEVDDLLERIPVAGVIGASFSGVSIMVANILKLFQIPQISYASTSLELSDKSRFEYFTRVVPPDNYQAQAMMEIVKRLGWTYVSTVAAEGEYGEKGIGYFIKLATEEGVCVAVSAKISRNPTREEFEAVILELMKKPKAKAVVLFVDEDKTRHLLSATIRLGIAGYFYWIGSDSWGAKVHPVKQQEWTAEGAITILPKRKNIQGFDDYFLSLRPPMSMQECSTKSKRNKMVNCRNPWFREYWSKQHSCSFKDAENRGFSDLCTGLERKELYQQEGLVPFAIDAVYAMAHSLHNLILEQCCPSFNPSTDRARVLKECLAAGEFRICGKISPVPTGKLLLDYIRNVSFTSVQGSDIGDVKFNKDGDGIGRYSVYQYQHIQNGSTGKWDYVWLGEFGEVTNYHWEPLQENVPPVFRTSLSQDLYFGLENSKWNFIPSNTSDELNSSPIPESVCSRPCPLGMIKNYENPCCWSCVLCREDSIQLREDRCYKCPQGYVADQFKSSCIQLEAMSISWKNPWFFFPLLFSLVGIILTLEVVFVFIVYRRTTVIMASGRELCFVLLFGILLSYTVPFVLLLEQSKISCALLRGGLGVCLNICYSAIFTKTSRISRIFNHKDQCKLKWISPMSQICICSGLIMIQLIGVVTWIIIDPPNHEIHYIYPPGDYPSAVKTCGVSFVSIIISLLYNIILVVLCTLYAFKTRKIPENFNEAKYIGFTMYSTCIVWLAFIPIFFGANHDYQVQICSLCMCVCLSASVTLCLLFGPKVYLVVLHPEKCARTYAANKTRKMVLPQPGY
ncbi:metabotropic glutamate receptor 6 isoform X2 [Eurytemora carolleeae]|uniref:metabotropic glutamate receptor 6 isoform X2 n=1 Tax=Eurytemora carolleeae TaxID=1294199 RepID=UPI000C75CA23|nr:metabotropic glutamate receptor 6 isoform X2 [Eurytemora carolleeae]|eukprot:XP_023336258.1 metabotropic glutamate receptor 6-like isoform X2 [Eurytemora affinis]